LVGGCTGCPGRQATFMNGIAPFIKSNLDFVKEIELVK
jgi:Fe-S cluster biogenesis protein NfuA